MDGFLQKLKKVVCIVLHGPAIIQSDCWKASQLPYNKRTLVPTFYFLVYSLNKAMKLSISYQAYDWLKLIKF